MHHIKPLTHATRADVRLMAQAAANQDEPLDTANVFEVGTPNNAIFTTEYLTQFNALNGASPGEFTKFEITVIEAAA